MDGLNRPGAKRAGSCLWCRESGYARSSGLAPLNYNRIVAVLHNLRVTLEMIKWEHSIFALPFALCGAMLAAGRFSTVQPFILIHVANGAARSSAVAIDRFAFAFIFAAQTRYLS